MGWPYCVRMTPILEPEAFVSMLKRCVKSGSVRTSVTSIACFRQSKASIAITPSRAG